MSRHVMTWQTAICWNFPATSPCFLTPGSWAIHPARCSLKHLWESARSMRTRNYCLEHKIPAYVSGLNGNVTVTLTDQGYQVETER